MILRRISVALFAVLMTAAPVLAQTGDEEGRTIDLISLHGPITSAMVDFAIDQIEGAARSGTVELIVLQINSPGVVASQAEFDRMAAIVSDPPLPLVAWIGPAPARAFGGAAQLVGLAPLAAAAPGVEIGYWEPTLLGDVASVAAHLPPPGIEHLVLDEPLAGVVDLVQSETASPRTLVAMLDGQEVAGEVLETLRPYPTADGKIGVTALVTTLREPGLVSRTLSLPTRPEVAFFLLVVGLTLMAFEFYAIGPGVAAGVAALCLALAGYGLAVLPVRPEALVGTILAMWLLIASYQRGGIRVVSAGGLTLLTAAGLSFTDAAPQLAPSVGGVLFTVAVVGAFFLVAMPVVARSRFSAPFVGRQHLVGREGIATEEFGPDGEVEVAGARWRATAPRTASIKAGQPVVVTGIDGWILLVDSES